MSINLFFQYLGASDCLAKSYEIRKSFLIIDFLLFSFSGTILKYFRSERRAGITERIRSRKQEATVRLIKRISSPLLGLQVGQTLPFSLLPTSRDREDQTQEAGGHCEAYQEDLLPSPWLPCRTAFNLLPPPYLN